MLTSWHFQNEEEVDLVGPVGSWSVLPIYDCLRSVNTPTLANKNYYYYLCDTPVLTAFPFGTVLHHVRPGLTFLCLLALFIPSLSLVSSI